MKYYYKVITCNTGAGDSGTNTGLLVVVDNNQYLFNAPDGFQRIACMQKMSFKQTHTVFVSSLSPKYFGGFPGLYMSAREGAMQTSPTMNIKTVPTSFHMTLLGPTGLRQRMSSSFSFMGRMRGLRLIELTPEEANKDVQEFGMAQLY